MQFFDTPVTRAWVAESLVRPWADKVKPGQPTDAKWEQGKHSLHSSGLQLEKTYDLERYQRFRSEFSQNVMWMDRPFIHLQNLMVQKC